MVRRMATPDGGINGFSSYQQGTYQPPATYADRQTETLTDTVKTQYEAEGTANAVLTRMTEQRHQLTNAHDNVSEMRGATDRARMELQQVCHPKSSSNINYANVVVSVASCRRIFPSHFALRTQPSGTHCWLFSFSFLTFAFLLPSCI